MAYCNYNTTFFRKNIFSKSCLLFIVFFTQAAYSQSPTLTVTKSPPSSGSSIAAVVNNDVITQKDLEDRLKVLLFFMRMPDTPENRQEILADVLKTLQEERLQLNEIKNAKLKVDVESIQEAYEIFEQQNGIPQGQLPALLHQHNLSLKSLEDQATSQVGWIQLIRSIFHDRLRINDAEVDEALQESLNHSNDTYYLISEIFLDNNQYACEADLKKHADHIFTQLTQGAPFPMIARHFSQSPSTATYGDIGWIRQDQMNTEWIETIEKMPVGSITYPIRTSTGIYIFAIRDVRKNTEQPENQKFITFKQVRFAISPQVSGKENEFMKKLQHRVQGCHNLAEIAPLIPGCKVRDIENIPAKGIPPSIQQLIKDLPEGRLSPSHVEHNNLLAYMVCYTETRTAEEVLREQIKQRLEGEKLNRISHQMLESLRQNIVDKRI